MLHHAEKHPQQLYQATGDASSSDSSTFAQKLEHAVPTGYAEDHDPEIAKIIKDGARDSYVHEKMNLRLFISLCAMSSLWIGSQIPLYFYGSVLPLIYSDVGGADGRFIWLVVGYLIPNAALCPFVGALSDLFGRKIVAITGQLALVIGPIVVSTAPSIDVAIVGMVLAGFGAGLNELISLAGTSELVPVHKRPIYVVAVTLTILPFSAGSLWANLLVNDFGGNWRFVAVFVATFNFIGLLLVSLGYKEPPYPRPPWRDTLRKVDYMGGLLSTGGLVLFLVGLNYGAQGRSWGSALVLAPTILGAFVVVLFFIWEIYLAKHPMVPKGLFTIDKRSMIAIMIISFFSGGNFFNVILFWPPETYNVYGEDLIQNGLEGLPIGMGIAAGSAMAFFLVGIFKKHTKVVLICACILMTAFTGSMSAATTDNLKPTVYVLITFACVGVGALILPLSIFAQAITPLEHIGTITAITLALRYIGGAVAFTAYYNVLYAKALPLFSDVGFNLALKGVSYDYETLVALVTLAAKAQYADLRSLIATSDKVLQKDCYDLILDGTKHAYASAYRWPWWMSIAFGGISIVAACFMRNIRMEKQSA